MFELGKLMSELDRYLNMKNYPQDTMDAYHQIIKRLGATRDPRACASLIKVLEKHPTEPDWQSDPGLWAIEALGEIADADAAGPLVEALTRAKYADRVRAAQVALTKIGGPAIEGLLARIDCRHTIKVLGMIGDSRAAGLLFAKLQEWQKNPAKWNRLERVSAMEALGRLRYSDCRDLLLASLQDEDHEIRRGAVYGLGWLGESQAISPLIEYTKNRYYVDSAIEILQNVLERCPQNIETEELRTIVAFPMLQRQQSRDKPSMIVDTSHLKNLARQELARRRA